LMVSYSFITCMEYVKVEFSQILVSYSMSNETLWEGILGELDIYKVMIMFKGSKYMG